MPIDHFHALQEDEQVYSLEPEHLRQSVDHLYSAMDILRDCLKTLGSGALSGGFSQRLSDSWLEINKCRIHTENIPFIEELLIPAMGYVNDAKCMFDSLVAMKLGMTKHGLINIVQCIREAMAGIFMSIEELESWMQPI